MSRESEGNRREICKLGNRVKELEAKLEEVWNHGLPHEYTAAADRFASEITARDKRIAKLEAALRELWLNTDHDAASDYLRKHVEKALGG